MTLSTKELPVHHIVDRDDLGLHMPYVAEFPARPIALPKVLVVHPFSEQEILAHLLE